MGGTLVVSQTSDGNCHFGKSRVGICILAFINYPQTLSELQPDIEKKKKKQGEI